LQTLPNHFLAIIVAGNQLGTVDVAKFIDARWLKMDVVDATTGRTGPASGKTTEQVIIVDVDPDHNRQALALS
jgi:hypothetical protein